jgi:hypothetical protein
MSEFFRTQTGRHFYESTIPSLVRELIRLNANAERLVVIFERYAPKKRKSAPAPSSKS